MAQYWLRVRRNAFRRLGPGLSRSRVRRGRYLPFLQRMPEGFSLWLTMVLQPASITPEPTNRPWLRKDPYRIRSLFLGSSCSFFIRRTTGPVQVPRSSPRDQQRLEQRRPSLVRHVRHNSEAGWRRFQFAVGCRRAGGDSDCNRDGGFDRQAGARVDSVQTQFLEARSINDEVIRLTILPFVTWRRSNSGRS